MIDAVLRTKPIFWTLNDGRVEAGVRVYYENSYQEFIAGVAADQNEAHRLAAALEAKLWAAHAAD
jgi:hypothetical protein